MGYEVFNNEERVLINSICKNEILSDLTKEAVLRSLKFSRQIVNDKDAMVVSLMDGIISKMQLLTDAEWDEMKMKVPFAVAYVPEDEVSETSADEE